MIKVGEHITLDFLGVKKDYSPEFYEKVIYKIAKAAKVEILNVASHKFEPQGFTLVALLSESHFSFHTFPERGVISFDFFTCGKVNPKVALKILRNEIEHERVVSNAFDRSSISLYDDIYSTPGQKKYYVVKNVLEKFTSKVGQFVEVMDIEEFGHALFIDHEIQVAEKDEKILLHLNDIRIKLNADKLDYELEFHFEKNEFFSEEILKISFFYDKEKYQPIKLIGTKIKWNGKEKNPAVALKKMKKKSKKNEEKYIKEEIVPTFFDIFIKINIFTIITFPIF